MQIDGKDIGGDCPVYVVAEMSGEHLGDMGRAIRIIDAAKEAGADAIKLQLFQPDRLAERRGGKSLILQDGLWAGRKLKDLYAETYTPWEWLGGLQDFAGKIGLTLFASVFDDDAIALAQAFDLPAIKIASREASDVELVSKAAKTGKPLIISTGTATDEQLGQSILEAVKHTNQLALLYCVSEYPAQLSSIDFDQVKSLAYRYGLPVGFSDHTTGIEAAVEAVKHGACIIEKHLTLRRSDGGPDAAFSLEPEELAELVRRVKDAH